MLVLLLYNSGFEENRVVGEKKERCYESVGEESNELRGTDVHHHAAALYECILD